MPGGKQLVTYVVAADNEVLDAGELRAHLKQNVPDYMVPSAFLMLDVLPVTPNGKVDRRALPAPVASVAIPGEYVAPRTPVEEVLAGIWAGVLRLDRVGVRDNFFELGGHSLLATRVVTMIYDRLNTDVPLRALFSQPTIRDISGIIQLFDVNEKSCET